MTHPPRHRDFETAVRENFAKQRLMRTLHAELARVSPGEVDIVMPYAPDFCQQNGFVHAGIIASIADSANGYAALTLAMPERDVLAVEFKINFLAPAKAAHFLAAGRVLRSGKTLTVCEASVHASEDEDRKLVATMLSTLIVRPNHAP